MERGESWAAITSGRLSSLEIEVIERMAAGTPAKCCSIELGLPPSTISTMLAAAARKLGLSSRFELLRLAGALLACAELELDPAALTGTEREILEMICEGLSNAEIATRRGRSVRTIANQVASVLAKTGSRSRRELIVAACGVSRINDYVPACECA